MTGRIRDGRGLSTRSAAALLAGVVLAWGTNWPVTKMIVQDVTPLWATALRCVIAAAILAPMLWVQGNFIVPRRGDLPVVFCTSILHLVAFSALVAAGLQFVPAGRAIVLGYTTPLWVAIGAAMFLSEQITRRRAIGIGFGLAGLAVIFNPQTLNWTIVSALFGSGLILIAAFCWAGNIVYVRAHKWISTPFQLVFWQMLLAAGLLSTIAWFAEGPPHIEWTARLSVLMLYSGIVCTAFANWAMTMVNRSLPAVTTSLWLLATPLLGIFSAAAILGEPLELSLFLAMTLIIGGIALGTVAGGWPRAKTSLIRHEIPVLVIPNELARRLVLELEELFGIAAGRHAQKSGEIVLQAAGGQEQHIGAFVRLIDDDVVAAGGNIGLAVSQRDQVLVVGDVGIEFAGSRPAPRSVRGLRGASRNSAARRSAAAAHRRELASVSA